MKKTPILYLYVGPTYLGSLMFKDEDSCRVVKTLIAAGSYEWTHLHEVVFTEGEPQKEMVS